VTILFAILAVVLATPALLVVGIALGPAILVIVFIGGIALVTIAVMWLVASLWSRHTRRTRVPRVHA
jgi:hypothetical protein